jgi:hypothetical protein
MSAFILRFAGMKAFLFVVPPLGGRSEEPAKAGTTSSFFPRWSLNHNPFVNCFRELLKDQCHEEK